MPSSPLSSRLPSQGKYPGEVSGRIKPVFAIALLIVAATGITAATFAIKNWSATAKARKLRNPVPATADALAAGSEIYKQHCQRCHGANGDGKGEKAAELSVAPGDFTDTRKMSTLTDGELFWEITKGRRPMPAFGDKLSDQERWQVVDWIRTFAGKRVFSPTLTRQPGTRERRGAPRSGSLQLGEGVRDFLDIRHNRNVVVLEPSELAAAVDNGNGAPGDSLVGKIDSEFVANGAAWLEIRK